MKNYGERKQYIEGLRTREIRIKKKWESSWSEFQKLKYQEAEASLVKFDKNEKKL